MFCSSTTRIQFFVQLLILKLYKVYCNIYFFFSRRWKTVYWRSVWLTDDDCDPLNPLPMPNLSLRICLLHYCRERVSCCWSGTLRSARLGERNYFLSFYTSLQPIGSSLRDAQQMWICGIFFIRSCSLFIQIVSNIHAFWSLEYRAACGGTKYSGMGIHTRTPVPCVPGTGNLTCQGSTRANSGPTPCVYADVRPEDSSQTSLGRWSS